MKKHYPIIVIGGGAAGIFSAIRAAVDLPPHSVLILEQSQKLLSKVKISGGGRCNVTHSCFTPQELVKNYPRGKKELIGPFTRFQPKDTIEWFNERGVQLKTEEDGRIFPISDDSQTIIDCLMSEVAKLNISIELGCKVIAIVKQNDSFHLTLKSGDTLSCNYLLLALGGSQIGYDLIKTLGHSIISPVPSLFTFNVPDSPLLSLSGISLQDVLVSLPQLKLDSRGPMLLTHWGFSGPAVLKLSAWAARDLHGCNYETELNIDWFPSMSHDQLLNLLYEKNAENVAIPVTMPKNLWHHFLSQRNILFSKRWGEIAKKEKINLINQLKKDVYKIQGKTTYKQEFVTAGGVKLSEVNFQKMESKVVSNLFFGGEVLDIDGVTGGFNFQAAWTTGWIAGDTMNIYYKKNTL